MNKKALSNVITTVLLILIGISAASIIAYNIFPIIDLSPEILCTEMQLKPPVVIDSVEFDSESRDLKVNLKRSFNSELYSLDFKVITDKESFDFACTQSCENCIILEEGSTSEYYFSIPEEQNPNRIILSVSECALQSYNIQ